MNSHSEKSSSFGPRLLGILIVLALAIAGAWWARGVKEDPAKMAAVKDHVKDHMQSLLDKAHIPSFSDGIKRVQESLSKQNLEEAEHTLAALKTAAVKDSQIAALEVRLTSAKIQKALSEGHLDRARELLQKAKESGVGAAEQIRKWEDEITSGKASQDSSSSST